MSAVRIRALTPADIPAAQRLREQAGWNQADDDWRRLLAWDPNGCWAAEQDGQVVGTTAVTSYGQRIAWVGMVLVDVEHRRRGIGQALLTHALGYLEQSGIQTVALDSTPAGQPLYARLGFTDAFDLARWRGPLPSPATLPEVAEAAGPTVRPFEAADLGVVATYDAYLFGTDRTQILGALLAGSRTSCFVAEQHGQIAGYVLSRPGARAWHLGPLAADDMATAERLARAAVQAGRGVASEMVMDVVQPNRHAVALAEALGVASARPFIRMVRGAPPPAVDLDRLYTSAGPELG